jgi:HK97 gp10 family phage protein
MSTEDLRIDGVEELVRKLNQLSQELRDEIGTATLTEAATEMADRARNRVPRRTGKLGSLIGFHLFKDEGYPAARVGVNPAHTASQKDGFYAIMVERGTKPRQAKNRNKKPMIKTANRGTAPRKPFLGPAFDEVSPRVVEILAKHLEAAAARMS